MIFFYNGFNLLLDIVFCYLAFRIGRNIGFREFAKKFEKWANRALD